ncbi:nuclear transport factor 2 family protein [Rhodococcus sp. NPDC003322]
MAGTDPNKWSREELEDAFQKWYGAVSAAASGDGSWRAFVDCFTPDAKYLDMMAGWLDGKDAIWAWAEPTLAGFPGSAMTFPEYWHLIDEVNGVVVVKLNNLMRDPGDGSEMGADNVSVLKYAGNGLFESEEDWSSPPEFIDLIKNWGRRAMELGTLSDDEIAWYRAAYPDVVPAESSV